ncbi:hypothetical protein [Herbiconiux sp. L3-i23]|uniref:hypothetical protein n=1 Tax=Herbiconiux sp. L3-i23 TaxID=2905871 RepID=UPI002055E957|nr:hypothetical protein [Herbiconiux sp. L3-i23]BDI22323.1 hypothetical protein L3i23_10990 [Herbiconiux sp. L3-i23]
MSLARILRSAAAGVFAVNAIPHGVKGVQGQRFPTPFADPPGVGLSSPTENVLWSAANAGTAALLRPRGAGTRGERIAFAVGAGAMAVFLSITFADATSKR